MDNEEKSEVEVFRGRIAELENRVMELEKRLDNVDSHFDPPVSLKKYIGPPGGGIILVN